MPRPGRLLDRAIVFALAAALCAVLVPRTVNGDGVGYLRSAFTDGISSGHLAWLPLLRMVAALTRALDPLSLLGPARALCILSAALSAALLHAILCLLIDENPTLDPRRARLSALVCALGFAASFGFVQAGSDVETYAPAVCALCLATWFAILRATGRSFAFTLLCACAVALAALLHVENVLFAPAAALLCAIPRTGQNRLRIKDTLALLSLSGLLVSVAYLAAASSSPQAASATPLSFLLHASHGFRYPLRPATPLIALYGIAKTLVYAPYPYQSSWPRVLAQTALGLAAASTLLWLARRPGRPRFLGKLPILFWALPYSLVGALYFASDNERWIFLLPLAWIAAAAGAATSTRALRAAGLLTAILVIFDVALGLPLARDTSARERADAAASHLAPGDLVVSPGHGWDEYIGFYRPVAIDRFPIIYYCGFLGDAKRMSDALAARAADTRAHGHAVYFARATEPATSDGWKDLAQFGVTPENVARLLPGSRLVPAAPDLLRLDLP